MDWKTYDEGLQNVGFVSEKGWGDSMIKDGAANSYVCYKDDRLY